VERLYVFVFAAKRMVKGAATLTSFALKRLLIAKRRFGKPKSKIGGLYCGAFTAKEMNFFCHYA